MIGRLPTAGLTLLLFAAGCASTTPAKPFPEAERCLPGDGFVPGPGGEPEAVPVRVEAPPPLPPTITVSECLDRARRFGRLDGVSVAAWKLDRKVAELAATPPGCRVTLEVLREKLGLDQAARVAREGHQIALQEYLNRQARLALAVEQACWRLWCAQRDEPAAVEEARLQLGRLLGLAPCDAARLVMSPVALPPLPDAIEPLLCAVVDRHPDVVIARHRAEIERLTRDVGGGDGLIENRQRWLRAQRSVVDAEANVVDEGARLLARWRAAGKAERDAGLARIELAHWLAWVVPCSK